MRLALLFTAVMTLPVVAEAAPKDITPMARYCTEALVDSRPLMTSALIGTTAEAVGRGDADERVEFFTVPHEKLVFSRLEVSELYACTVFPMEGSDGWTEASVAEHLLGLHMLEAPDCVREGETYWFSSLPNLRRKGVTAVADIEDGAVVEILAFETPELTRPSDCEKDASE